MRVFWLAWHLACALALFVVGFIVIGLCGVAPGVLQGRDLTVQTRGRRSCACCGIVVERLVRRIPLVAGPWRPTNPARAGGFPAIVAAITFCGLVAGLRS